MRKQMPTMQVRAIADDQMPGDLDWAVVKPDGSEAVLLVSQRVAWSREELRLLNEALRCAS